MSGTLSGTFLKADNAVIRKDLIGFITKTETLLDGKDMCAFHNMKGEVFARFKTKTFKELSNQLIGLDKLETENKQLQEEIQQLKAHIRASPGGFEFFEAQSRFQQHCDSESKLK